MMTLDEVIKALEVCQNGTCKDCPSAVMLSPNDYRCSEEHIDDALYYLKMYRSDMQMYAENQKHWEDELMQKIKDFGDAKERFVKRLKELDIGTLNEPLAWDELKSMVGKPVWVEVLDDTGDHYKWRGDSWYIVKDFTQGYYGWYCHLEPNWRTWTEQTYGDLWQAYQKER